MQASGSVGALSSWFSDRKRPTAKGESSATAPLPGSVAAENNDENEDDEEDPADDPSALSSLRIAACDESDTSPYASPQGLQAAAHSPGRVTVESRPFTPAQLPPALGKDSKDFNHVVLWQFECGEDWQPFPLSVCRALEGSFAAWNGGAGTGPGQVQVSVGSDVHLVDFKAMRTSTSIGSSYLSPSSAVHRAEFLAQNAAEALQAKFQDALAREKELQKAKDAITAEKAALSAELWNVRAERDALRAEKEARWSKPPSASSGAQGSPMHTSRSRQSQAVEAWQSDGSKPGTPGATSPTLASSSSGAGQDVTDKSWRSRGGQTAMSAASWASAASQSSAIYSASMTSVGAIAEWVFAMKSQSAASSQKAYDRVLLAPNDPRKRWLEDYIKNSMKPHRRVYDSTEWCSPPDINIVRVCEVINDAANTAYRHQLELMQMAWTEDRVSVPELDKAIPIRTRSTGVRMNEALLFHGCKWEAVFAILREGFDSRLGGTNTGAAFGIGSYFSTVASKADGYTQRWADWEHRPMCEIPPNLRCLLVARVALGEVYEMCASDSSLRRPPLVQPGNVRCDSVLGVPRERGGCVDYDEFVIYKTSQAAPQFIIEYEHTPSCCCRCCLPE
eukprot:TRINITY_DN36445_c0_g1_i1.p1 TRINITY_DN36445_c0_g1~~TRINITY_DN36445_c0_g1_i1.p1  ORF type:complete len:619 (+),score=106.66 TRINITY_DN36445_c0_g1_i1:97-1953(+)